MKITPEIIPHDKFHEGIWLLPVGKNHWYYFLKKQNGNNTGNAEFLKSVDAPLKELVKFLHEKKIKTTPSCSGHFHDEKFFYKTFYFLRKDEIQIKTNGLNFVNIESGEIIFLKNRNYLLPFTETEFLKTVCEIQRKGIIGIRFEKQLQVKEKILQLRMDRVKIENSNEIVFIHTSGKNKKENELLWKKITSEIKNIFQWKERQPSFGMVQQKPERDIFLQ